jgi:N-hydroxyarylamine O-acetyltransferase
MSSRAAITDDYLSALGLQRSAPSMALLKGIMRLHLATFPFASIGPRLGESLPLDLPSLHDRIVVRKRGGYCFEQNGLAYEVLEELGFSVTLMMARVLLRNPVHPGLTHRFTMVNLGTEKFIVDVGFGPLGPRFPVNASTLAPADSDQPFRVVSLCPGEFTLVTHKDGADVPLYRFEHCRYGPSDCELGHFYSHRHPDANFVNNLVACRKLDDETRSLLNRDYRVLRPTGDKQREIRSAAELKALLEQDFDLLITSAESERLFAALPPRA